VEVEVVTASGVSEKVSAQVYVAKPESHMYTLLGGEWSLEGFLEIADPWMKEHSHLLPSEGEGGDSHSSS
jgi:hypothetical protein